MSDQLSSSLSRDPEAAVQIIGETGGTVVYIFPGGDACVKKGKKLSDSSSIASLNTATNPKKTRPQSPLSTLARQGVQENQGDSPKVAQTSRPISGASFGSSAAETDALGQKLVEAKLISAVQLQVAKYDLETSSMGLAEILIARGWVNKAAIAPYL